MNKNEYIYLHIKFSNNISAFFALQGAVVVVVNGDDVKQDSRYQDDRYQHDR